MTRLRCCIPFCKRTKAVAPETVELICDECWMIAPEKQRDAYARAEDYISAHRAYARLRRTIIERTLRRAGA